MCHCVVTWVSVTGLVDSGADITIMGGELFKCIAVATKLRKWELKRADKTPRTYEQRISTLHGHLDLHIEFAGRVLNILIYVKMDAPEDLLLSEGVSRQLGIIHYHPVVRPMKDTGKLISESSHIQKSTTSESEPSEDCVRPS